MLHQNSRYFQFYSRIFTWTRNGIFYARSKGLVQTNNLKHFPIDHYIHDRMTPATLSPTPLAYEKPIHPAEMPRITTCTELPLDDTNKSTSDDKYPWLDPDDIRRNMTDKEIL